MTKKNKHKPFSELVKQIEAYGLKDKLADLVHKEQAKRPFRHLPKQFSKGILIGNIAIVPKKSTGTRYIYVIADMIKAQILYDDISLKQTAILVAHNIAENKEVPRNILEYDTHFASKLFEIRSAKGMVKSAQKEKNADMENAYLQRVEHANYLADDYKARIQNIFHRTFDI